MGKKILVLSQGSGTVRIVADHITMIIPGNKYGSHVYLTSGEVVHVDDDPEHVSLAVQFDRDEILGEIERLTEEEDEEGETWGEIV